MFKKLDKIVIKLEGNVNRLLEGVSCGSLEEGKNAFLDKFGRIVVLFDQKIERDVAYLVFNSKFESRFWDHCGKYLKLNKTKAEKLSLKVVHAFNGKLDGMEIKQRAGSLFLVEKFSDEEISDEEYKAFRIENDISEQGVDFDNEMILNTNWKDVPTIKRCYLGQEVVARVIHLGKPPKKLARVLFSKIPEKITVNGREVGKITSHAFSEKYGKHIAFCFLPVSEEEADDGKILE